jgi:plastocyanin
MRVLSARLALGTLVVGTVCLLATPADAGPFRKRAATNDCCPQTSGYAGYGGYGATAYAPGAVSYDTTSYSPGTAVNYGTPMYTPGVAANYGTPCCGGGTPMYAPSAAVNYGTPCCGSTGGYASGGYGYAAPTEGRRRLFGNRNNSTSGGYAYASPSYSYQSGYGGQVTYPPGTIIQAGGIPSTTVPEPLPTTVTEATKARITDESFEPKTLTIAPGTTVRWTNDGKKPHTVTSDKEDWGSGEIPPAGEFTATFTKAGTFDYHCKLHKDMKGTIIVKEK